MSAGTRRAGLIVAGTLLTGVVTQAVNMLVLGGPTASDPAVGTSHADRAAYFTDNWPGIATVWTVELATFLLIAVAALVAMEGGRTLCAGYAALAVAGVANAAQVGIGLAAFRPAVTAGDALEPLFTAVLATAFLFYFVAKALIGLVSVAAGLVLWRAGPGSTKALGAVAVLAGLAAAAINIAAVAIGRSLTLPAGATGTAAALTAGLAIGWIVVRGWDAPALDSPERPG